MAESLLTAEKDEVRELAGSKWVVIIYNDDVTARDFVFSVLVNIFGKSDEEADTLIAAAEADGSAPVKYYNDLSLAEVALSMVENMKKRDGQPNFRLRLFEIIC